MEKTIVHMAYQGGMDDGLEAAAAVERLIAEAEQYGLLGNVHIEKRICVSTSSLTVSLAMAKKTAVYPEILETLRRKDIAVFRMTMRKWMREWFRASCQNSRNIGKIWKPFFEQTSLFSKSPLSGLIRENISHKDLDTIFCGPELEIMTLQEGERPQTVCWSTKKEPLVSHPELFYNVLDAAVSLPVNFEPELILGSYYSDSVLAALPIYRLADTPADLGIIVGIDLPEFQLHRDRNHPIEHFSKRVSVKGRSSRKLMSLSSWLDRYAIFTRMFITEISRRMLDQFESTNMNIRAWSTHRANLLQELADLSPERKERLRELLEADAKNFDFAGRYDIPVFPITNREPLEEANFREFSNEHLRIGFNEIYLSALESLWDIGWLTPEFVAENSRLFLEETS